MYSVTKRHKSVLAPPTLKPCWRFETLDRPQSESEDLILDKVVILTRRDVVLHSLAPVDPILDHLNLMKFAHSKDGVKLDIIAVVFVFEVV